MLVKPIRPETKFVPRLCLFRVSTKLRFHATRSHFSRALVEKWSGGWRWVGNAGTFSPIRHVTYVLTLDDARGEACRKLVPIRMCFFPEFQSNFFSKYVCQAGCFLNVRASYATKCFYADVKTPRRYIGGRIQSWHFWKSSSVHRQTFHPSRSNMYRNVSTALWIISHQP